MASQEKKKFLMRIEPDLWSEVEQLAAKELRSINGQVEYLLREAIDRRKGKTKKLRAEPQQVQKRAGKAGR